MTCCMLSQSHRLHCPACISLSCRHQPDICHHCIWELQQLQHEVLRQLITDLWRWKCLERCEYASLAVNLPARPQTLACRWLCMCTLSVFMISCSLGSGVQFIKSILPTILLHIKQSSYANAAAIPDSCVVDTYGAASDLDCPQYYNPDVTLPAPGSVAATPQGCYSDDGGANRRMTLLWADSRMTIDFCAYLAKAEGYSLIGLQYSIECWCVACTTAGFFCSGCSTNSKPPGCGPLLQELFAACPWICSFV